MIPAALRELLPPTIDPTRVTHFVHVRSEASPWGDVYVVVHDGQVTLLRPTLVELPMSRAPSLDRSPGAVALVLHEADGASRRLGVDLQLHAIEQALAAGPDARRRPLAGGAGARGEAPDSSVDTGAAARLYARICEDVYRVDCWRELYDVYFAGRRYDEALCVAAALHFLKKASEPQEQLYESYRLSGPPPVARKISDELRAHLSPDVDDDDRGLADVFDALAPAVARLIARGVQQHGLRERDRVDVQGSLLIARVYNNLFQVLALRAPPAVFVKLDQPQPVRSVVALDRGQPSAVHVVGHPLLRGRSAQELVFTVARRLAYQWPGRQLLEWIEPDALDAHFRAARRVVEPDGDAVMLTRKLERALTPGERAALAQALARLPRGADIERWRRAMDLSSLYTGFALCGDLEVACKQLQSDPPAGGMSARERVKALLLYSVSPPYFALRRALGLALG